MMFFIAGAIGGLIRGVVGVVKYSNSYKDVEVRPYYFASTIVVSGAIGLITAWIVKDMGMEFMELNRWPLSLGVVVGYAGGDFIENIFKIVVKQPILFQK